jgi:hypothetical protein
MSLAAWLRHLRPTARTLTALLTGTATVVAVSALAAAPASAATIEPLPANLEQIRAAEATTLYGSPGIRPLTERQTSIVTMGDSEISGEGQGPYERGTNGDDDGDGDQNWCHRALHAGVHRTGIAVNKTYNLACSGATTQNLIYGSGVRQWDELNQGDYLAIKARNLHIKLIWVVASANDSGGIEFGPVMTECTINRLFFLGECWPDYTNEVAARVTVSGNNLATAINNIKQTMINAGYLATDYQMVVMGYPSPVGPDVEDNPNFPGWYNGGCTLYLRDMAFGRNKVVPMFEAKIRQAALSTGVKYLDASRLFAGHEPCTELTWVSGLTSDGGDPFDGNTYRQSFHPNYRGHGAFGTCMGAFYNSGLQTGTCVDPRSSNATRFYGGLMSFRQLRNAGSSLCMESEGYSTRNGYDLLLASCNGGGNQGWWYDSPYQSLHVELTHDRCVDAQGGVAADRLLIIYNCHGGTNQQWRFDNGLIRNSYNPNLCVAAPSTAPGGKLWLRTCNAADPLQIWRWETQTGTVGFGYNDWIPDSAY